MEQSFAPAETWMLEAWSTPNLSHKDSEGTESSPHRRPLTPCVPPDPTPGPEGAVQKCPKPARRGVTRASELCNEGWWDKNQQPQHSPQCRCYYGNHQRAGKWVGAPHLPVLEQWRFGGVDETPFQGLWTFGGWGGVKHLFEKQQEQRNSVNVLLDMSTNPQTINKSSFP